MLDSSIIDIYLLDVPEQPEIELGIIVMLKYVLLVAKRRRRFTLLENIHLWFFGALLHQCLS